VLRPLRTPAPATNERPLRIQQQMQDLSDQSRVRLGWCSTRLAGTCPPAAGRSSKSSGTERSTGPGRPFSGRRNCLLGQRPPPRRAPWPPLPTSRSARRCGPGPSPGRPPAPGTSRLTCPTIAMTGAESDWAACRPIIKVGRAPAPARRAPEWAVPVSCATALAMERRSTPSWRVVTIPYLVCDQAVQSPRRTLARDGEGDPSRPPGPTFRPVLIADRDGWRSGLHSSTLPLSSRSPAPGSARTHRSRPTDGSGAYRRVSSVVRELQCHRFIELSQTGDDPLKVVLVLAEYA